MCSIHKALYTRIRIIKVELKSEILTSPAMVQGPLLASSPECQDVNILIGRHSHPSGQDLCKNVNGATHAI